jgi:hypothetical protein
VHEVNATAAVGLAREPQRFVRTRPDHPEVLLGWLADPLGLMPGPVR